MYNVVRSRKRISTLETYDFSPLPFRDIQVELIRWITKRYGLKLSEGINYTKVSTSI